MNRLLVIGGASIDVLHLKDRTVTSAGGAAMYTAMAARRCGVQASLFGPRPDPCPERLEPVAERFAEWLGPLVPPEKLPAFEISYRHGKTEYLNAFFGAETELLPSMLPADLSDYDHVHVIPLGDVELQLSFVGACRERGARQISAGTYIGHVTNQPQAVRAVLRQSDLFFMNGLEVEALFGSLESAHSAPGKVLYVTLGAEGACILQGDTPTLIPAVPATELDPTGAGDTFCGATVAYLLQGQHPIMAARRAAALAAEMIGQVGPAALLSEDPPPEVPLDPRVRVNEGQVRRVAEVISTLPEVAAYPFVSPEVPPVGHPKTLDFFFAATLQQFSFWTVRGNRYHQPLIARIGGAELKGSDYLWEAFRRALERDAEFCSPQRQAQLGDEQWRQVFRADNGEDAMPALELHVQQARSYGQDMLALGLTPQAVLDMALSSPEPLLTFMILLDTIGGYKEDPLRKKSGLLALILNQRPERFLPLREDEEVAPVIDYHALRSSLRVGLIDVLDDDLRSKLLNREIVSAEEEWAVRYAAYRAEEAVVALSGKSTGAVDHFFFSARRRCPEMTEPECNVCPVDAVCAHRKGLFQPVLRTTFY